MADNSSPNIIALITARITSTRLTRKAMRLICGKPMIQRVYERVKKSKYINEVVIATTKNSKPIILWAKRNNAKFYIGSEEDILGRLYHAARLNSAEVVVRIWGDAPLNDPVIIDETIKAYFANETNYIFTTGLPAGLDVAVISYGSLQKLNRTLKNPEDRHWIHKYLIEHPVECRVGSLKRSPDMSLLDWSVDTQYDLDFARLVYKTLGEDFKWEDVLRLLCKAK